MKTANESTPAAPDKTGDPHLLEVKGLHVHYDRICALDDVGFTVSSGTAMALVGRNGSGKSTLLKALAGLLRKPAGSILWKGRPLRGEDRYHYFAYLPQREEIDWNFPLTVRGLVEMGLYNSLGKWKPFRRQHRVAVDRALASMDLDDLGHRRIGELSGGQQQRAFIARALAGGAQVLLLDEPFTGLDTEATAKLRAVFRDLVEHNHLVLASHHDLRSLEEIFDKVLLLRNRPLAIGTPGEVLTADNIRNAFQ